MIQRIWQHWAHKKQDEDKQNKKYNTICVGQHNKQINTNNVNKTQAVCDVSTYTVTGSFYCSA
jgi:hypothetical protein